MNICIDFDGDIMAELSWLICWFVDGLYVGYLLVICWLYVVYCIWILTCLMNI